MKTKTLILAALAAVVLAGCDVATEVLVPPLPKAYWDYFPYEVGDSVVFTNGTKEMAFEVGEKYIDKEAKVEKVIHETAYARISFDMRTNPYDLEFGGTIAVDSDWEFVSFTVAIGDANPPPPIANGIDRTLPCWDTIPIVELGSYEDISPRDYMDVRHVSIEKGRGIISFYDASSKEEWVLKEVK